MSRIKKTAARLFSMKAALFILGLLIIACIAGSVIPQGEIEAYYTGYYPKRAGMVILLMGLDDVFHCWWFAVLTMFLCANLLGCNLLRFPSLYRQTKTGFSLERRLSVWDGEPETVISQQPEILFERMGFRHVQTVEHDGIEYRYAVRNRAGLWGAWLTHLGMLIIIVGFALGQMATVKYTVYGVPGQTKPVADTGYALTIDDFNVALRADETVEQYTSTLTLTDIATGESRSGETSVNHPLSLFGMKLYQNSTGWAANVQIWKGEELLHHGVMCAGEHIAVPGLTDLVLAFNAFYPDYVMGLDGMPSSASSQVNNPAYLYTLYYKEGVLGMNVLMADERITVEEYSFIFSEPRNYTLIQLKHDPFTWLALMGGLVMMLALLLAFYLRTEELWALRLEDGRWGFAGYSKKGSVLFRDSLLEKAAQLTDSGNKDGEREL